MGWLRCSCGDIVGWRLGVGDVAVRVRLRRCRLGRRRIGELSAAERLLHVEVEV